MAAASPAAVALLLQPLLFIFSWFGWEVSVGIQLLTVAAITLGLVVPAARTFRTVG